MASKKNSVEYRCVLCGEMVTKRRSSHSTFLEGRICKEHLKCAFDGKQITIDKAIGIKDGNLIHFVCSHHKVPLNITFNPNVPPPPKDIREDDTQTLVYEPEKTAEWFKEQGCDLAVNDPEGLFPELFELAEGKPCNDCGVENCEVRVAK